MKNQTVVFGSSKCNEKLSEQLASPLPVPSLFFKRTLLVSPVAILWQKDLIKQIN
jgi:hypothetical protein